MAIDVENCLREKYDFFEKCVPPVEAPAVDAPAVDTITVQGVETVSTGFSVGPAEDSSLVASSVINDRKKDANKSRKDPKTKLE